ncbi:MAG: RNA polymerase sigma factor [Phycisphaerae bacterium]
MAERETSDVDEPVVEAVRAGDRYAFGELVQRHNGWVRGVIFGVLGGRDRVDDVTQQVWVTVWQRIGDLRDAKRWRPWLYRLARNAAIDAGRDATRRRNRSQTPVADLPLRAAGETPNQELVGREKHRVVLEAIRALPALYREPFVMRHLSGWTYSQIAEVMGMPVDSVETRLVRARRFLRESLKDKVL